MTNTILKDIIDSMRDIGSDAMEIIDSKIKSGSSTSISRQAKRGTLQFTTIVSRSLSLKDASMIVKAIERQDVSFIRTVTSLNSVTQCKNVDDYLQSLHQNLDLYDSFMGSVTEATDIKHQLNNIHNFNIQLENLIPENQMIIEYNDLPLYERKSYFKQLKEMVKDPCYKTDKGLFTVSNDGIVAEIFLLQDENKNFSVCKTAGIPIDFKLKPISVIKNDIRNCLIRESKEYESPFNESCLNDFTRPTEVGIINEASNKNKSVFKDTKVKTTNTEDNEKSSIMTVPNSSLMDNDVKKANELVPTMVRLITNFQDKNGKILRTEEYVIGVKAVMHPVSTDSMIQNLVKGIKKNDSFFNFIKLTTGEISFFKDFVFALNDIKDDIKTKYRDNPWWSAIKRRKQMAKTLGRLKLKNFKPNATIVASQDEINLIKQQYKIDFEKAEIVKKLMNNYFLLGFVICDPSTETCKFFFDGDMGFSTYSYTSLERENSDKIKEISNIMQILGKM